MYQTIFLIVQLIVFAINLNFHSDRTITELILLSIINFFLVVILFKQYAAFQYKAYSGSANTELKVVVVISFYNEKSETLQKSIDSLLNQTVECSEIYVYDDGSNSEDTFLSISNKYKSKKLHFKRFKKNRGKRFAQVDMFKQMDSDIFVTLDSDTVLDKNAIEEGLKPFNDPYVFGVSGHIRALDSVSLLSKLYSNLLKKSFTFERSAQSVLDSVLVATGMFSMYRSSILENRLDHYLNMSSDGLNMSADDKRLTTYSILKGRVVQQMTAQARTVIPQQVGNFFKQQLRWARGFFSETFYTIKIISKKRWAWWLSLIDLSMWFLLPASVLILAMKSTDAIYFNLLTYCGTYMLLFLLNLKKRTDSAFEIVFIPFLKLIHIFILFPIRIVAIISVKSSNWLTRN